MNQDQPILWRHLIILLGRVEIAKYMRSHKDTISAWVKHRGFPACPLPNGNLATTVTLIDTWLKARSDIYREHLNEEGHRETCSDKDDEQ